MSKGILEEIAEAFNTPNPSATKSAYGNRGNIDFTLQRMENQLGIQLKREQIRTYKSRKRI